MTALTFAPHEIRQAFFDYSTHLKQAQIDALIGRSGISPLALARDPGEPYGFPVASARVDRLEDGRFEFSEGEGTPAFVVLARDLFGDVRDIVAMRPGADGFVAPYIGALSVLGANNLGAPRLHGDGLAIHRTLFDWLRADRQGSFRVQAGAINPSLSANTGGLNVENTTGTQLAIGGNTSGGLYMQGRATVNGGSPYPISLQPLGGTVNIGPAGLQLNATTVAGLYACGASSSGIVNYVTDASAPAYGQPLTGGGTVRTLALCNGTNWTAH